MDLISLIVNKFVAALIHSNIVPKSIFNRFNRSAKSSETNFNM